MSGSDKTEKATPKKLKDLRGKGIAARSTELPNGVALLVLVLLLPGMLHRLLASLQTDLAVTLSSADVSTLGQAEGLGRTMVLDAVRALAPAVLVVGATGLLSGVVVTRSRPNLVLLKPQAKRMSPVGSVKRMLSAHSVVELAKSSAKLLLLTAVAVSSWKTGYARLLASGTDVTGLRAEVGSAVSGMLQRVAVLALAVGVLDAVWQRMRFGKQSRMTKHEVREEHKQSEGNPHTKGKMRARMLAGSRRRMVQAVPKADVVLANPTHLVVALAYEPGSDAPVVVAKGAGVVADRIKAAAVLAGVPVLADKPLARAIYRATEVGDRIPPEVFRAVAEVLAVVYAAKRRGTRPVWRAVA